MAKEWTRACLYYCRVDLCSILLLSVITEVNSTESVFSGNKCSRRKESWAANEKLSDVFPALFVLRWRPQSGEYEFELPCKFDILISGNICEGILMISRFLREVFDRSSATTHLYLKFRNNVSIFEHDFDALTGYRVYLTFLTRVT